MTPKESAKLIKQAGGDREFAALIGIADKENYRQRVHNWKRRGIPANVVLAHYELIQRLLEDSQRQKAS